MRRIAEWISGSVMFCSVVFLLAGCVFIPQPSKSVEGLAGVWEFVDPQGVTSTMSIEADGRFTVDRAPVEAFRVRERFENDDWEDWDGEVDWERAEPISGGVSIGPSGQVGFSTRDSELGGSLAYENPFQDSLGFIVGNVDNGDRIRYIRVTDE